MLITTWKRSVLFILIRQFSLILSLHICISICVSTYLSPRFNIVNCSQTDNQFQNWIFARRILSLTFQADLELHYLYGKGSPNLANMQNYHHLVEIERAASWYGSQAAGCCYFAVGGGRRSTNWGQPSQQTYRQTDNKQQECDALYKFHLNARLQAKTRSKL